MRVHYLWLLLILVSPSPTSSGSSHPSVTTSDQSCGL
uniref:CD22 antigen n=1 Tax=Mus musculus TaxID=10090 RepID=A0A087WST4_MOUSE